jgi:hypothetical protein
MIRRRIYLLLQCISLLLTCVGALLFWFALTSNFFGLRLHPLLVWVPLYISLWPLTFGIVTFVLITLLPCDGTCKEWIGCGNPAMSKVKAGLLEISKQLPLPIPGGVDAAIEAAFVEENRKRKTKLTLIGSWCRETHVDFRIQCPPQRQRAMEHKAATYPCGRQICKSRHHTAITTTTRRASLPRAGAFMTPNC